MEMADLSTSRRKGGVADANTAVASSNLTLEETVITDNTIPLWSYVAATWYALSATIGGVNTAEGFFVLWTISGSHREYLTPLEGFLSTHFAVLALSMAVGLIVAIPPDAPVARQQTSSGGHCLLVPMTCGSLISAFLSYNTPASKVGPLATFMTLGCGMSGLWGIFALLFAGSLSVSRKTGADKHTSRFLFANRSAASAQKKQWKKERNGQEL